MQSSFFFLHFAWYDFHRCSTAVASRWNSSCWIGPKFPSASSQKVTQGKRQIHRRRRHETPRGERAATNRPADRPTGEGINLVWNPISVTEGFASTSTTTALRRVQLGVLMGFSQQRDWNWNREDFNRPTEKANAKPRTKIYGV